MENQDFDLVAIGDIVTDAFIRLQDASAHCQIDKEVSEICLNFGEKVPYESVTVVPAVGNSPNAAVSAARLGLRAALVANLGADETGREALKALEAAQVDARWVTTHDHLATNYHYVLWYHDDRTILIKHEKYPYVLPFDLTKPKWVYLSSLGEDSLAYHQDIAKYLTANPEIKLAFQPGTFQIKFGAEALAEIYQRTEIFFCNVGEAQKILNTTETEIKSLLLGISKLGPKIVVITDAKNGAYLADPSGSRLCMPPYPDAQPPLERTGAGDAFASTFVSALALGEPLKKALAMAPINSMSVVQQVGAQKGLLTRDELEKYLGEAPADYRVKEI